MSHIIRFRNANFKSSGIGWLLTLLGPVIKKECIAPQKIEYGIDFNSTFCSSR